MVWSINLVMYGQEIPDSCLYICLGNDCVWFGWIHHNKIKGDSGRFIICVDILWPVCNKYVVQCHNFSMTVIQSHSEMCN